METFGALLAELRQEQKMTQRDLANVLYVTTGTISNYENGVHLPDVEKLMVIADYFKVSTDYLLGRCTSDLPPDILEQKLLQNRTAGEVIREISRMTPERKQALAVILEDMKFGTLVDQRRSKDSNDG